MKSKKIDIKTLEKYYVVDIGLRTELPGSRSVDTGYILENVVCLELLRRGYDVYVGKLDEDSAADYEGIRRINVLDWMMRTVE